jgi:hypothetical protein
MPQHSNSTGNTIQGGNARRPSSLIGPIFGSHIERIGALRTFAGALAMYCCIPALVVLHLTVTVLLYQWLLRPLLGTTKVRWADYVIIDRHRIKDLSMIDKFNCMFCGYANGLTTMANREFDLAGGLEKPLSFGKQLLTGLIAIATLPLVVFFELNFQIIYNLLTATPFGMHRISIRESWAVLREANYASAYGPLLRFWFFTAKSLILRFAMGLEQIESSWCPLRHFEQRAGVVYPEHHKKFFGPDEVARMRDVLCTRGTVSDRLPKY